MCLVAIAIDDGARARFPFVVAANRDEFRDRPSEALHWWSPHEGRPPILAGRDVSGGGTWLGVDAEGRFALLTNVRDPGRHDPAAPSRGAIVPLWLRGDLDRDAFVACIADAGHNGFNVVAGDFARGECFWTDNRGSAPRRLERGVWGLSNAGLDTPWPKVQALKQRVAAAIERSSDVATLADRLFDALADRAVAADASLPDTGIPRDWERALSAAFIDMPGANYGTRCSTLLIGERGGATHIFERSFDSGHDQRHVELPGWPLPGALQSARTIST